MERGFTEEQEQEISVLVRKLTDADPAHVILVARMPVTEGEQVEHPLFLTGYGSPAAMEQLLDEVRKNVQIAMIVNEIPAEQYGK